jgi:glycosyltransferase involved in cell wall biosynthesis
LLFRQFGCASEFASRLRKFVPTLVHAHFGLSGPAGLALAKSLGVPLVVTYHGQDATISDEEARKSWRGREYLKGRQQVMKEAGAIIAVSDFIRAKLLDKGYPEERVITHRNGIDLSFFDVQVDHRESVALFVGRLVEKKGCEYLLKALAKLRDRGFSARAVILGDGPLRPSLESLAHELRVDADFQGFLPLTEVRAWLSRASVVVVPSVTAADGDSEGLPTVILEAQAACAPVVATRHAGNGEGVVENGTAILVDERDAEGLAAGIRLFLSSPTAVASFGQAGRRYVGERFSLPSQVEGLERIYDRVRGLGP